MRHKLMQGKEKDYDRLPAAKKRTDPVKRQRSRIKEAGSGRENGKCFKAWRRLRKNKEPAAFPLFKIQYWTDA